MVKNFQDFTNSFAVYDEKLEQICDVCSELQFLFADSVELSSELEERTEALRDRWGEGEYFAMQWNDLQLKDYLTSKQKSKQFQSKSGFLNAKISFYDFS